VIGLIPTIFADLALLPILLAGLVLMRRRDGCTLGLSSLVWRQVWQVSLATFFQLILMSFLLKGVIWLLIVFLSETPAAVSSVTPLLIVPTQFVYLRFAS
jgi:hypothetical protein